MADDDKKTFSLDEHTAILADRVARETADLSSKVTGLETNVTELSSKLDVAEAAKTAAEQRATAAEEELASFKAEVTEREAAAARKDERLKTAREAASHLGDEFFADEKRIERITAMKDEAFETYVADLAATAPAGTAKGDPPRQTAMAGDDPTPKSTGTGNAGAFLLGRFGGSAAKGA